MGGGATMLVKVPDTEAAREQPAPKRALGA